MIFDGGIVGHLHLTIPQSFCFAKIQPPLHKGAFLLSLMVRLLGRLFIFLYYSNPRFLRALETTRSRSFSQRRAAASPVAAHCISGL